MKLTKSGLKKLILEEMNNALEDVTEVDDPTGVELDPELAAATGVAEPAQPGEEEAGKEALEIRKSEVRGQLMNMVPTLVQGAVSTDELNWLLNHFDQLIADAVGGDIMPVTPAVDRAVDRTNVHKKAKPIAP